MGNFKRKKQFINAERRIWIFIAYNDHVPFFSKLFINHLELKKFSGKHSAEWKDKCERYSSTYLDLYDQTLLPGNIKTNYWELQTEKIIEIEKLNKEN